MYNTPPKGYAERKEERVGELQPIVDSLQRAGIKPRDEMGVIEPLIDRAGRLSYLPQPVKRTIHRVVGKALGVDQ